MADEEIVRAMMVVRANSMVDNAPSHALAALLVHDARELLEWTDLSYAIALNGMNSSISPPSLPVQLDRPNRWLNWHAQKMLNILGNRYLFEADNDQIIQDHESLRNSSIRQASAWMERQLLEESAPLQINSSDHNPVVARGLGPRDPKEVDPPHLMHFYVQGGALSHGEHEYILSNANRDPATLSLTD